MKFLEKSLTYTIMFKLQCRRLLPGLAQTLMSFDGRSRQLAGYTLWNCPTSQGMRNPCYCPQQVTVVPSHPWHRNWLHIQPVQYGTGDQTWFSLHLLGADTWAVTVSQLKGGNFLPYSNKSKSTFNCTLKFPCSRTVLPLAHWNTVLKYCVQF